MATDDMTYDDASDDLPDSHAEQLDPAKLGEGHDDPDRAADAGFPPDAPLGVDDPSLDPSEGDVAPDDVEQRAWRERPEPGSERSGARGDGAAE